MERSTGFEGNLASEVNVMLTYDCAGVGKMDLAIYRPSIGTSRVRKVQ